MSTATFQNPRTYGKISLAALLALTFCMANPASTVYAKKRKLAKYGSIKILSTPGGLPIEIDGKPEGLTTTDYRAFDRDPGYTRSSSLYQAVKDGLEKSIFQPVGLNVWRSTSDHRRRSSSLPVLIRSAFRLTLKLAKGK